jgi:tetratricopeptide (TPR) repeat protein
VLEQHTTLYNRADVRHRFYWWTNAGVEVWDDTRILYPTEFTASHGFTFVDTWPIDAAGHDVSIVGNHKYGPVSRFTHGSREPYMGVYHPRTKSGIVHYSPPVDLPAKKFWSWSSDADGLDWRRALSDNNSAYVEIQAGPFRNQETYGFLEPQQTLRFSEYWLPMLDLGGLSRATADAMLNLSRTPEADGAVTLEAALNTVRAVPNARVQISEAGRRVLDERADLLPAATWRRKLSGQLSAATYTVRVSDAAGAVVLEHTEGVYDLSPRGEIRPGVQAPLQPPPARRGTDGDAVSAGAQQELDGQLLVALATYQEALTRHPDSLDLLRSAGRLLVALKQYDAAVPLLTRVLARVSNDREAAYYLALAQAALGRARASTLNFEIAQQYGTHRAAALFNLAAEASRVGRLDEAIDLLGRAIASKADAVRAGAMEVAVLRSANRPADARQRLAHWRRVDPTNSMLRLEAGRLGAGDASLWAHLAADPERILEIAVDYMTFGLYADAIALLGAEYPSGPAVVSEPGMPRPESYPLIAYYRGYCQKQLSHDGAADYAIASGMPTAYVFPHRPMSIAVLKDAAAANPKDATAHFLLGSLYLSGGMTGPAMKAWEEARALTPSMPTLHRNMGSTLLATGQVEKAIEIFREGMKYDAANVGIYTGLDQALSKAGRPAGERADAILAYPDQKKLPASLVYKLAVALAEAGRFDEAEGQFQGRFFPREEGGINVRQIWLEVRARRAAALAKGGDCGRAMGIVSGLSAPVASLAFTKDGLEPLLARPTLRGLADGVRSACGGVVPVQDADVPYTIGSWDADRFGNHRAVVRVTEPAGAVFAHIPWRRPDAKPEDRHLIVVEGASGGQILNVERVRITREAGDIVFEAPSAGDYFVYYLPNTGTGRSNYPTVTYPAPQPAADLAWLRRHGLDPRPAASWTPGSMPVATVVEFQAIEPLHSFYPMQVAATPDEVAALLAVQPTAAFLVFAEDRTRPIKMAADLPLRWVRRGAAAPVVGDAMRGEY